VCEDLHQQNKQVLLISVFIVFASVLFIAVMLPMILSFFAGSAW